MEGKMAVNETKIKLEEGFLEDMITKTSNYFSEMVNFIPTKYYVPNEEENNTKYQPKSKRKKNQQSDDKKLLAKKAKMLKLDPSAFKTTEEFQLQIEKKEHEFYEQGINGKRNVNQLKMSEIPSLPLVELRKKLHSKVAQLRGNRPDVPSNVAEQQKKSREDRKIKKATKKRTENRSSENLKHVLSKTEAVHGGNTMDNQKRDIVYSKLDFAINNNSSKKQKNDLKKLLTKAESKRDKIITLEKDDKEKAQDLKEKYCWENALKKAEGQKLKDDPKLLKRTIKRKEKTKEQNKRKWRERVETVEKQKQDKQNLRKQHLKERHDTKLNKKHGKKKK